MNHSRRTSFLLLLALLIPFALRAQVTPERLLHANDEPQNWLTYSGNMMSQRYSALNQVTPQNVKNLELKWVFQARSLEKFEATPLVVDGVMYTVQLIDEQERLVSLTKSDLREFTVLKTTSMPSYKDKFSAQELADLEAYLLSLKGVK